jgi:amino acid permease
LQARGDAATLLAGDTARQRCFAAMASRVDELRYSATMVGGATIFFVFFCFFLLNSFKKSSTASSVRKKKRKKEKKSEK